MLNRTVQHGLNEGGVIVQKSDKLLKYNGSRRCCHAREV